MPAEKGDPRNLTNTPALHERSPPGRRTASRSRTSPTRAASTQLHVAPQDGKGEARTLKLAARASTRTCSGRPTARRSRTPTTRRRSTGSTWRAARREEGRRREGLRPGRDRSASAGRPTRAGSPTRSTRAAGDHLVSVLARAGQVVPDHRRPVRSRRAGVRRGRQVPLLPRLDRRRPGAQLVCQSTTDNRRTRNVYLVVLRNDIPSPLARESDEEKAAAEPAAKTDDAAADAGETEAKRAGRRCGSISRARAPHPRLPLPAGRSVDLQAGDAESALLPARRCGMPPPVDRAGRGRGCIATTSPSARTSRSSTTCASYHVSADGKKAALRVARRVAIVAADRRRSSPSDGRLAMADLEVRIDPRAEWAQIFDEAWRINRDYFYAPNMHGADWPAMKKKYEALLPDVAVRSDLNASSGGCSASWPWATQRRRRRSSRDRKDRPRRPARGRLRDRQRPVPLQEGLRRAQLDARSCARR